MAGNNLNFDLSLDHCIEYKIAKWASFKKFISGWRVGWMETNDGVRYCNGEPKMMSVNHDLETNLQTFFLVGASSVV